MANGEKPFDSSFINEVEQEITSMVIDRLDTISYAFFGIMVAETLVDYGQARAGWNFTLNAVDESAPAKPPRVKKGEKKNVIPPPEVKPNQKAKEIGDGYHVTNFVQHVIYLNEGNFAGLGTNYIDRGLDAAIKAVDKT